MPIGLVGFIAFAPYVAPPSLEMWEQLSLNNFYNVNWELVWRGMKHTLILMFVVPVLVAEETGPITAIKRSSSLFKRTWGEQVVANFGFGIIGIAAALVGLVPAILVGMVVPMAGLVVGVVTVGLAIATVSTLEAIFKAALYGYVADGRVGEGFERSTLESAYGHGRGMQRGF